MSIYAITPSMDSIRLCGGILVASPTAIPVAPFTKRLGNRPGSMSGSRIVSSKFHDHLTVFLSMSRNSSKASGVSRASV